MRKASSAQNFLTLINFLQDREVRKARRLVLTELVQKPSSSWDRNERDIASVVYSTYDTAGIMVKAKLVPGDLLLENWGPSIARCYSVIEGFLLELSARVPDAAYGKNFRWLRDSYIKMQNCDSV
jgi:hypothetical protein